MLRSVNSLIGYSILATDGTVGRIDDLFFDDKTWSTAYLSVKVGGAPDPGRVLLPPTALGGPDWQRKELSVVYTREQVTGSLALGPVARGGMWRSDPDDPHLRSTRELIGYRIQAADSMIGHLEDIIADDSTWTICHIVDIAEWLGGNEGLIAMSRVQRIVEDEQRLYVDFTKEMMLRNPGFSPSARVGREYHHSAVLSPVRAGGGCVRRGRRCDQQFA